MAAINDKQVATAFLTIIIEDENDNNPKFRKFRQLIDLAFYFEDAASFSSLLFFFF